MFMYANYPVCMQLLKCAAAAGPQSSKLSADFQPREIHCYAPYKKIVQIKDLLELSPLNDP